MEPGHDLRVFWTRDRVAARLRACDRARGGDDVRPALAAGSCSRRSGGWPGPGAGMAPGRRFAGRWRGVMALIPGGGSPWSPRPARRARSSRRSSRSDLTAWSRSSSRRCSPPGSCPTWRPCARKVDSPRGHDHARADARGLVDVRHGREPGRPRDLRFPSARPVDLPARPGGAQPVRAEERLHRRPRPSTAARAPRSGTCSRRPASPPR